MFPENMGNTLAACLVISGILVYFGIHVVARKVIFVDLALAQIAALGTVVGVMMGYEAGEDPLALYLYSLALTAAGALIFAVTKTRFEKVPHEAIIGIVYAVAFAATLLILSKSPLGPSEMDRILKGEILYVSGAAVLQTALLCIIVGVFHVICRKQFLALSFRPDGEAVRMRDIAWDFLFYLSFGFVVTRAVAIAGVFLVFAYLIIPAVGAMIFTDRLRNRLAIGWIGAGSVSVLGVKFSHDWDLPTSPLIVCFLAGALLIAAAVRAIVAAKEPRRVLIRLGVGTGGLAVLLSGLFLFRKGEEDPFEHALHQLESESSGERIVGLGTLAKRYQDRRNEWLDEARALLGDPDKQVRLEMVRVLNVADEPSLLSFLKDKEAEVRREAALALRGVRSDTIDSALLAAAQAEKEFDIRLEMLKVAIENGLKEGVDQLIEFAADPKEDEFDREDAFDVLSAHLDLEATFEEVANVRAWWQEKRESLRWNRERHRFE